MEKGTEVFLHTCIFVGLAILALIFFTIGLWYQSKLNYCNSNTDIWCYNDWKCPQDPSFNVISVYGPQALGKSDCLTADLDTCLCQWRKADAPDMQAVCSQK